MLPFFCCWSSAPLVPVTVFNSGLDPCGRLLFACTAATASCDGENISVLYMGGIDAGTLVNIRVYGTDPATTRMMGSKDGILPVGSSLILAGPFFSPAQRVAIAHYTDGTDQVILDTKLKCGSGPARTPDYGDPGCRQQEPR